MNTPSRAGIWTIARIGAGRGVALTFAYALVFATYAILRSSPFVWTETPAEIGAGLTLFAHSLSIVVACVSFAALLSIPSALIGGMAALLIAWANSRQSPHRPQLSATLVGTTIALAIAAALHIVLHSVLSAAGRTLPSLGIETYMFWFGIPSLIFVSAASYGAMQLSAILSVREREPVGSRLPRYSV